MIKIIDEFIDKQKFNKIAAHPLQSWEWGQARKQMEIQVVRIGVFEKDNLIETYQMTIHLISLGYKIGYIPRSTLPTYEVLEFLYQYGEKNNLIFIKIEPYEKENSRPEVDRPLGENFKLVTSPHPLFPPWTQMLDLTKSEEDLLKNMKQKTRYNIKLAQKKGVVVKEMSSKEGFEIFQKLYFDTCKRQKYFGHTKEYHEIVWNSLKDGIAHILIAFYEDKPLAAYELFKFKDIFYYPYGGTSVLHRNLMAANLLMWEAIRLGKKLGATTFDMWGSLPQDYDQHNPWAGFTRFKEGYGTTFTKFVPGLDLVVSSPFYSIYNIVYELRNFYLSLRQAV